MNVLNLRRAALFALTLLPLMARSAAAETSADFNSLIGTRFSDIRLAAAQAAIPSPFAQAFTAAPFSPGGVFIQSSFEGRLAYCSASGCKTLRNDGVDVVVLDGHGALYFTGTSGTGHCTGDGCALLLPGVQMTLTLAVGPQGDVYGSDSKSGWRCTPDGCRQVSNAPLPRSTNYIQGVYKSNGGFVASGTAGTFWCAGDECRRVSNAEITLIEENCEGTAPAAAAYGFFGQQIYRCTPDDCRAIGSADSVDNFAACAFDEKADLLLPASGDRDGEMLCSEKGIARAIRPIPFSVKDPLNGLAAERTSDLFLTGEDGATYRLAIPRGAPAAGSSRALGEFSRVEAGNATALRLEPPLGCWRWGPAGDDDRDVEAWRNGCRLFR